MKSGSANISVIIPTRNREAFLREALHSVLSQTVTPLEIIVVDDGSTDGTAAFVRGLGHPVRHVVQQQSGPAAARNAGLVLAAGEYIAFLDDDDEWPKDRLEAQLPHLVDHPGIGMVLGHTQRMIKRTATDGSDYFEAYREPVRLFHLGAGLFRKSLFESVGNLDERMRYAEDDDWFMRAEEMNIGTVFLPGISLFYRFHDSNMVHARDERQPYLLHLLKNRLDRKRGTNCT